MHGDQNGHILGGWWGRCLVKLKELQVSTEGNHANPMSSNLQAPSH